MVAPAVALVLFAVPLPQRMIESLYSRRLYWAWQRGVTSLSNLAPFALLDMFILCAVVWLVWRAVRLIRTAREAGALAAAWEGGRRLLRTVSVLGILFLMMWGLNYRRVPLDQSVQRQTH